MENTETKPKGRGRPRKYSPEVEATIRARVAAGETKLALAKEFDLHPTTVKSICDRG